MFTCPPCSFRSRPQQHGATRRLTYCSVNDPKPRLHCFSESHSTVGAGERGLQAFTFDLKDSGSSIVKLETFTVESGDTVSIKLLAVHQDGEVRCLSHDLQVEEWRTKAITGANLHVEHALVLSIEQATQSVLKNREDILAKLGHDADLPSTRLLFFVTRASTISTGSETPLCVRIFYIGKTLQPLQELLSLTLPEPRHSQATNFEYSWHCSSGTLFQNSSSFYAVYSLSGLVPQLSHHMPFGTRKPLSCIRMTPSLVALNTSSSVSILDIHYSSIQDEQKLESSHNRKARLLSYFAPLDVIVAIQGRKLLALQVLTTSAQPNGSQKRKRGSLLIDSIGRGSFFDKKSFVFVRGAPRPLGTQLSNPREGWDRVRGRLDILLQEKNFEEFESVMADQLGIGKLKDENLRVHQSVDPAGGILADLRKVHYLLKTLFSIGQNRKFGSKDPVKWRLEVSWFPELLCHWLIRRGLFSVEHIETSLKKTGAFPAMESLKIGSFTEAIVDFDPSLKIIQFILSSPVVLESEEIVHVLRHCIGVLSQAQSVDRMRLFTSANANDLDRGSLVADEDISMDHTQDGKITHALLETVLLRLNTISASRLTRALKSQLSTQELRSFVDLLRIELARGRWLSPYVEDRLEPAEDANMDNGQVCVIANLLNCAVDSLGAGGWIHGASIDLSETGNTIAYMKAEISAALGGIEEATYLKGLLGEVLLYGNTSPSARTERHNILRPNQQPLQIQSIFMAEAGLERSTLPLGLKPEQRITAKRVVAGGELVDRSKRDLSRLRSRMVGKYTFDRITI